MKSEIQVSKFLSLVLRHQPQMIGLALTPDGWADVEELIAKARTRRVDLTPALLEQVVRNNDKQRFSLSEDKKRIRANQGHSVAVDLGLPTRQPPDILFHGTATRFIASIEKQGLNSGSRQHVHLSANIETAIKVGSRHGVPIVLRVDAKAMYQAGLKFFMSDNGVWLTDHVPARYLSPPIT